MFDILPLYGTLKPGDTEQVTFTFFGHQDTTSVAKAICEVEGGPTYEVMLKGEASLVQYRFDCLHIDYGKQVRVKSISGLLNISNSTRSFTILYPPVLSSPFCPTLKFE